MPVFTPPVGFHFLLRIEGLEPEFLGLPDIGFTEVSGISHQISTEEFKEGGENRYAHRLPTAVTYGNLVCKRGMMIGSQAYKWWTTSIETFSFKPTNIILILLNELHVPVMAWNFNQAYPVKWSVDGFNSTQNGILIESMEFTYQYYTTLDPTSIL